MGSWSGAVIQNKVQGSEVRALGLFGAVPELMIQRKTKLEGQFESVGVRVPRVYIAAHKVEGSLRLALEPGGHVFRGNAPGGGNGYATQGQSDRKSKGALNNLMLQQPIGKPEPVLVRGSRTSEFKVILSYLESLRSASMCYRASPAAAKPKQSKPSNNKTNKKKKPKKTNKQNQQQKSREERERKSRKGTRETAGTRTYNHRRELAPGGPALPLTSPPPSLFCRFESLDQEMNSLMGRVLDVNQTVQELVEGGHPSSDEVRSCQDHLNSR